jgi:hypothetical protein
VISLRKSNFFDCAPLPERNALGLAKKILFTLADAPCRLVAMNTRWILLGLGLGWGCRGPVEATPQQFTERPLMLRSTSAPTVTWRAEHAATDVVLKFVARRADGTPLCADDVSVQLLMDGAPLDSEAILQADAKAQEVNLMYSLVLDATRSMLLHSPPAFEPMKLAAQKSVRTGTQLWTERPGIFAWTVNWFDDFVYRPAERWPEDALLGIADPDDASFTRLYAAVDFAIDDLAKRREEAGLADDAHNVMVIFTDGHDNHPAWNPPQVRDQLVQPEVGHSFHKIAWPTVEFSTLLEKIRSTPALTVHTIGMGNDIDEAALRSLAQAGNGIFVNNGKGSSIEALFARVTREFTTIQSSGATIPNPSGDHDFTWLVTAKNGAGSGKLTMRLHIGDADAKALSAPQP